MADLSQQVRSAGSHVTAHWTPQRAQDVLSQLQARQVKRRQRRQVGVALLLVAVIGGGLLGLRRPVTVSPLLQTPVQQAGKVVQLSDGSLASTLDSSSQLTLLTTQPEEVRIHLRGAASFQVAKNPKRLYRVETERVAVEVLGTRFVVKELPDRRVHVAVAEGRVRVLWDKQQRELGPGTSGDFPIPLEHPQPGPTAAPPVVAAESANPAEAAHGASVVAAESTGRPGFAPLRAARVSAVGSPKPGLVPVSPAQESWQSLAEQGKFELAYHQAFHRNATGGFQHDGDLDPADLLLLADVARFSAHPSDAVAPLQQLLRQHPKDPRSPLASFTLGRILLDDLGQPREAAQSFRHAEELDPEGPLSQDALGREVEAWSRAGEQSVARSRAEEYVRRYPSGRRLRSVRRYGDLD